MRSSIFMAMALTATISLPTYGILTPQRDQLHHLQQQLRQALIQEQAARELDRQLQAELDEVLWENQALVRIEARLIEQIQAQEAELAFLQAQYADLAPALLERLQLLRALAQEFAPAQQQ